MARMRMMLVAVLVGVCGGTGDLGWALSLDEAKANGHVGEKASGYLGVVSEGNAEAQALAEEVNRKRRLAYEDIARRNGTSVNSVEALAGEKAIRNTKPGHVVEGAGGWTKK